MKFLFIPFALLYGVIVSIRNMLYDYLLKPYQSKLMTIGVGNLQVGGSGKTPMTAWLYNALKKDEKIAILSRGYGRKTKGLIVADAQASAESIGDEPMWYYQNLKEALVIVSESREEGLKYLENTDTTLVLLDDAFQHRAVKLDINILMTEHRKPYFKDFMMPFGRLREPRVGAHRADVLVVSKCPSNMDENEMQVMGEKFKEFEKDNIYFSTLEYGSPYCLNGHVKMSKNDKTKIIALSGLAYPGDFIAQCKKFGTVTPISYKDHHKFTAADIEKVNALLDNDTLVICTEKDAVKLMGDDLKSLIKSDKYFALPVAPKFLQSKDLRQSLMSKMAAIRLQKSK